MSQRRAWQQWELDVLRTQYAHTPTQKLSRSIGRSESAVYGRAAILGLKKSETYLAGPDACRLRRGDNVGASCRFLPGHVPANKGLRRPGFAPGRMAQTQFKPGARPHTWKPIGSTRLSKDGYVQRKVSDTGYPQGLGWRTHPDLATGPRAGAERLCRRLQGRQQGAPRPRQLRTHLASRADAAQYDPQLSAGAGRGHPTRSLAQAPDKEKR